MKIIAFITLVLTAVAVGSPVVDSGLAKQRLRISGIKLLLQLLRLQPELLYGLLQCEVQIMRRRLLLKKPYGVKATGG
ncbi:hypothetical protein FE257_007442 [Aspergillus nanangensis]|uniref:Uncharacterized protein n=1 Tax=Aspergillus nanangensis TaxID=2582783 RepID=A0AAD4GU37_ASPNN|nr:hypothetical protein FE257_007442 [Aspergillus nanangensis]